MCQFSVFYSITFQRACEESGVFETSAAGREESLSDKRVHLDYCRFQINFLMTVYALVILFLSPSLPPHLLLNPLSSAYDDTMRVLNTSF